MILGNIDRLPEKLQDKKELIKCLLEDLCVINRNTSKMIFIEYQDWHDEYSSERTDPCPDYYGCFWLKAENDTLGEPMTLDELDSALLLISDFVKIYACKN